MVKKEDHVGMARCFNEQGQIDLLSRRRVQEHSVPAGWLIRQNKCEEIRGRLVKTSAALRLLSRSQKSSLPAPACSGALQPRLISSRANLSWTRSRKSLPRLAESHANTQARSVPVVLNLRGCTGSLLALVGSVRNLLLIAEAKIPVRNRGRNRRRCSTTASGQGASS